MWPSRKAFWLSSPFSDTSKVRAYLRAALLKASGVTWYQADFSEFLCKIKLDIQNPTLNCISSSPHQKKSLPVSSTHINQATGRWQTGEAGCPKAQPWVRKASVSPRFSLAMVWEGSRCKCYWLPNLKQKTISSDEFFWGRGHNVRWKPNENKLCLCLWLSIMTIPRLRISDFLSQNLFSFIFWGWD